MATADVSLSDRYELESGRMLATGVQAAVRALLDQLRADRRAGLSTAALVSGYQGSPLAAFDVELARNRKLMEQHGVHHIPGLNEELGATAVWGSQVARRLPDPRVDGVLGVWYGKAPGLDRAGDAIRHGNWVGTERTGGVLALVGDDPASKSSTLPSASEAALADFGIPTLYPGTPQEVLDFGLHGFSLSRACGLWTGMKLVTNVADGFSTIAFSPDRIQPPVLPSEGAPFVHEPHANLLAPATLELEQTLVEVRLPRAAAYAGANGLNRAIVRGDDDWLGVVAAGKSYYDARQALEDLGFDDAELRRAGIRLIKLGMIFPLEAGLIRELCAGLEEVLVVEEKRPFVESQIRDCLYGTTGAPRVVGKKGDGGGPLLSATGEQMPVDVAAALVARLTARQERPELRERLARLRSHAEHLTPGPELARTPFFCSGCPHNRSTEAPDGVGVGIGIGCHTMVLLNPEGRGDLAGVTQMGGEGAHWIGMAPFTGLAHFIQNIGDGTFHHSGSLAVRFAIAAGADVTFKLLYNRAVAMTGGQHVEGAMQVPELTRMLEAEGVQRTIVTTDDPGAYRGVKLAANAEVRDRSKLISSQKELAGSKGVTVLIHDQACAAELRRLRKRGKAPEPELRVTISERVCEGCGDCGEKSSCLSVQPVATEFGRKTQINQASCNKDYSCLDGDCPSFVTVTGAGELPRRDPGFPPVELPDPPAPRTPNMRLRLFGIGGTGVVTVNQVLGMAALLDDLHIAGLDQTGLAQKGGPVISDLRISERPIDGAARASAGSTDALLIFDLLTGTVPVNLAVADPGRSVAIVSTSAAPTGQMVTDTELAYPALDSLLGRVEAATRPDGVFSLDSEALAADIFADTMPANMITLGAAFQRGALPMSAAAIERAIALNGAATELNLKGFAWGRACVAAPDLIEQVTRTSRDGDKVAHPPTAADQELIDSTGLEGELRRLLEIRIPELGHYQGRLAYAKRYADYVTEVAAAERAVCGEAPLRVTEAVARNLFKLMAYKDEYEVARLHLIEYDEIKSRFGPGAKFKWNLHPPVLRSLGLRRKLRFGVWFKPFFRILRLMRRLRGTPLDLFGLAKVRRIERALIGEYRAAIDHALTFLGPATRADIAAIAELPDMVRGYEQIKLDSVDRYRAELARQLEALKHPEPARETAVGDPPSH